MWIEKGYKRSFRWPQGVRAGAEYVMPTMR